MNRNTRDGETYEGYTYDTPEELQPMTYADVETQRFMVMDVLLSWKANLLRALTISITTSLLVSLSVENFHDSVPDRERTPYWPLVFLLSILFTWFGASTSQLCYGYYRQRPTPLLAVLLVFAQLVLWLICLFPAFILGNEFSLA
ncbi:hypothetical protein B0I72DRAFT_133355 [Yarrowia lipolytica]|jgi:hypothetical protein|uniref:Uncharacterized protein n=1 Tax=Yarrowia lipolytica TaxID=4952 RepID=A0A371CDM5_YARLL|nr:hypothetical protein BKA91DRAFT_134222 [Yarrowia lipolytica]KAE8175045.1 hypothetical protein BKA90DRAFT_132797 [Yarrowia lipolytica]RDW28374.1 hypothetical protein B0I71DRAFT_127476 [Yarrowia lipolytica]RDW35263.1 hypothetical protein B0I72DRAFT_133355 [Yarrowia lipolytica]RDW40355.1 hypothetical protein B0I73DRAFT_130411 [Yarrowia lipolytica]